MAEPRLVTLTGEAIRPRLRDLARLRATVFRDWPYLYEADAAQEDEYQGAYARSPHMHLILALDGEEAIGAATCLPLRDESANVRAPFESAGLDVTRFFYFGESVLLPAYRGTGLGVRFFEAREAIARAHGNAAFATFCAVIRPDDHPLRPPATGDLHAFWRKRGYVPIAVECRMCWRDLGQPDETEKTLRFWAKPLRDEPLPVA
ncbi:GNAT family N-acetyltransferase [Roseomonas sp. CCTCC AB2023176]|uniref:GNAT family N-acetyltransferase n=1 Tax=Roseomonas sp. CCTCC AB2023176 TaxID=3342640 RepID=UPI0035D79BF5